MRSFTFLGCAGLLIVSLLFGGGAARGLVSDFAPQFVAALSLTVFLPGLWSEQRGRVGTWALFLSTLVLLLFHLAPLPPSIWTQLPGREKLVAIYDTAQAPLPWLPLAMRPGEAVRSALNLLPAAALFVGVLRLTATDRLNLVWIVVVFALLNVPVGMLQLMSGGSSLLYFYEFTNMASSVGLFANANHCVALIYSTLPLAALALSTWRSDAPVSTPVMLATVVFTLLLGLAFSGARTAVLLGAISLLASYLLVLPSDLRRSIVGGRRAALAVAGFVLVLPILMGVGLQNILLRIERQGLEDARWIVAQGAWQAMLEYLPFGAGWGSFERIYQLHENTDLLMSAVVNHVHNDWLEVLLEGGLPAGGLAIAWIVWFVATARRALGEGSSLEGRMAQAAMIVLFLLALHSIWDYPLRTAALSAIFALCTALTQPAALGEPAFGGVAERKSRRRVKRRKSTKSLSSTNPVQAAP